MHKSVFLRFSFAAMFSFIFISNLNFISLKHQHSRVCLLSPVPCGKETSAVFVVLDSFGHIAFRSSGTTKKQGMYRVGQREGRYPSRRGCLSFPLFHVYLFCFSPSHCESSFISPTQFVPCNRPLLRSRIYRSMRHEGG